MVTRASFQSLAESLQTTFADFFIDRTFTAPSSYDPVTDTVTAGATETVSAVRMDYDASQVDGQIIQKLDFKLLALVNDFSAVDPRVDGVKVDVDGTGCQVINAEKDAAEAVWTLQVRAL